MAEGVWQSDRTGSYTIAWILCMAPGVPAGLIDPPADERPLRMGAMEPARWERSRW